MKLSELKQRTELTSDSKGGNRFRVFNCLLIEIAKKDIPDVIKEQINGSIEALNVHTQSDKELVRVIKAHQVKILKLLEEELKIVPKNHYRNLWMAIGLSAFGLPLGVVFGTALKQMAFLGIGLPIGMTIGVEMDKKAIKEGRQLGI